MRALWLAVGLLAGCSGTTAGSSTSTSSGTSSTSSGSATSTGTSSSSSTSTSTSGSTGGSCTALGDSCISTLTAPCCAGLDCLYLDNTATCRVSTGRACTVNSDCASASCVSGVCKCAASGALCQDSAYCCAGLTCQGLHPTDGHCAP